MIRVKICGLTRVIDVNFAVLAGADAVGFIVGFPTSPRNLSLKQAEELAKKVPPFVDAVLVTTAEVLSADPTLSGARFDALQLYGDIPDLDAVRRSTGARLIRAYPAKSDDKAAALSATKGFDAVLTDTFLEGQQGGTGTPADWTMCRNIKYAVAPMRTILSGGLNSSNVAAAIHLVRPYAVDASSGVESAPGIKDPGKVMEFIKKAKVADW
jgi:phosphoribosylanthranilate isomerase